MLITWHTRFSFGRSAADLSDENLRAQIEDAADLVDLVVAGGRPSEPAYYMWHQHLPALLIMGMLHSMEWTFHRGYDDKTFWKFSRLADDMSSKGNFQYWPPPWFRDADLCRSHRSVLTLRYPEAYADLEGWGGTPERMPLLWPVVSAKDPAVAELRVAKADLPLLASGELIVPSAVKSRVVNL